MKRLLLFAILLSISSSAGASTSFYLTDYTGRNEIPLAPPLYEWPSTGLDLELLLWYTGDPIFSFDVEVNVTGPGTIIDGIITATGRNPDYDFVLPLSDGIELGTSANLGGSLGSGIANPLAKIDYNGNGWGDVWLTLYNIYTCDTSYTEVTPICHGAIIYQLPEPVTMVLLGLGGLLIRNKK